MTIDPYAEWLGIPSDCRPPNHYDLLGLAVGEADAKTFYAAAMERMAKVRRFHVGAHGDAAQRIIQEISEAYTCLSDPQRKRHYDRNLRGGTTLPVDEATSNTQADLRVPDAYPVEPTSAEPRTATPALPSPSPGKTNQHPLRHSPASAKAGSARSSEAGHVGQASSLTNQAGSLIYTADRKKLLLALGGGVATLLLAAAVIAVATWRSDPPQVVLEEEPSAEAGQHERREASDSGGPSLSPIGQQVTWLGALHDVVVVDDEVHFLISAGDTASFEAFFRGGQFALNTCDYVAHAESGNQGDRVIAKGEVVHPQLSAKHRLSDEAPLLELTEIQRDGDAGSRVVANSAGAGMGLGFGLYLGGPSPSNRIVQPKATTQLAWCLRYRPKTADAVSFVALYQSADGTQSVTVSPGPNDSRRVQVQLADASALDMLGTLKSGDQVQVEGKVSPASTAKQFIVDTASIKLAPDLDVACPHDLAVLQKQYNPSDDRPVSGVGGRMAPMNGSQETTAEAVPELTEAEKAWEEEWDKIRADPGAFVGGKPKPMTGKYFGAESVDYRAVAAPRPSGLTAPSARGMLGVPGGYGSQPASSPVRIRIGHKNPTDLSFVLEPTVVSNLSQSVNKRVQIEFVVTGGTPGSPEIALMSIAEHGVPASKIALLDEPPAIRLFQTGSKEQPIVAAAWCPKGTEPRLALGGPEVCLWNAQTGKLETPLQVPVKSAAIQT